MTWRVAVLALSIPAAALAAGVPSTQLTAPADIGAAVSKLVDETTRPGTQQQALEALMDLGPQAVPYIVAHLNDGRRLPSQSFWVRGTQGKPDMQYHPWFVHDGLTAVLAEITGIARGPMNGHLMPSQRERVARKWVTFCMARYPTQAAICQSNLAKPL